MKFIEKVKKPTSIVTLMQHGMAGYDMHRGVDKLHVSDLTKPGFCPREYALLHIDGSKKKGMSVNASLRHTFDMGRDIEARVQNDYLRDLAWGDWQCTSCDAVRGPCSAPKTGCDREDIRCNWRYKEIVVKHHGVQAGLDVVVNVGKQKLRVVELKTMIKEEFMKLKAPLIEHRLRTIFYLWMVKERETLAEKIDTKRANVVYVAKSYGNWDQGKTNYSPFKEYEIEYDEDLIAPLIKQALHYMNWWKNRVIPHGICNISTCKRAKSCPVVKQCFSGSYPQGDIYNVGPFGEE